METNRFAPMKFYADLTEQQFSTIEKNNDTFYSVIGKGLYKGSKMIASLGGMTEEQISQRIQNSCNDLINITPLSNGNILLEVKGNSFEVQTTNSQAEQPTEQPTEEPTNPTYVQEYYEEEGTPSSQTPSMSGICQYGTEYSRSIDEAIENRLIKFDYIYNGEGAYTSQANGYDYLAIFFASEDKEYVKDIYDNIVTPKGYTEIVFKGWYGCCFVAYARKPIE